MQTIDLDLLTTVTGGQQAPNQGPSQQDQGQGQGGSWMSGLDQFFQVLQSPGFSQVIGGLRDILGSFASGGQQQQQGDPQSE